MPVSFKNLRAELNVSQEELATYLGVSRSFVTKLEHGIKFESGNVREKLNHLAACLSTAQKKPLKKKQLDPGFKQADADQWLIAQRARAAVRAEELNYKLKEMQAEYTSCIRSLQNIEVMMLDPKADKHVKTWLSWIQAKLIKKAKKIDPKAQAKLILRRDEALGIAGR